MLEAPHPLTPLNSCIDGIKFRRNEQWENIHDNLCKSLPTLLINLACEKKYWTVVKMVSTKLFLFCLATCSILQSAVCIFEDQTDQSFKINAVYKGKNVRTTTTSHMYILHPQIVSLDSFDNDVIFYTLTFIYSGSRLMLSLIMLSSG
jgi:hypothetical protein